MTRQQAEWAKQHDWWVSTSRIVDGGWYVTVRNDDYNSNQPTIDFDDYQDLREWAGY